MYYNSDVTVVLTRLRITSTFDMILIRVFDKHRYIMFNLKKGYYELKRFLSLKPRYLPY